MKETIATDDRALAALARALGQRLLAAGLTVATAESCTGGWIAKVFTDVPGSSGWFGTGFVSYSNEAKQALLGVTTATLAGDGAVSEPVVQAMAQGARDRSGADYAIAVSGIAGPDGGTAAKPVGLVWFAWAGPAGVSSEACRFAGDRESVRRQTVAHAIEMLRRQLAR